MKIILTQDVEGLGKKWDIVTVKDGYARNYLIPKGYAIEATKGNIRMIEEIKRQTAHKRAHELENARELARRLESLELVIPARVGEENRIFGTITTQRIAEELAKHGIQVDRRQITLDEDIRTLGVYTATVKLHPEVEAKVRIQVVPETPVEA